MKGLMSFVYILGVPLIILNALGGIVSGIWLAILGEWTPIGFGILILICAPYLLSGFLMASAIFALAMTYFLNKGKTFGARITASLSILYTNVLILIWCCGIFFIFMTRVDESDFIPRLIWSYGVALGPWSFLASKDRDNFASIISTLLAELAYITLMLFVLFSTVNLYEAVKIFGVFMIISLILELTTAVMIENEQKKLGVYSEPVI